eukprot:3683183-Prymnesium_polylepis.1
MRTNASQNSAPAAEHEHREMAAMEQHYASPSRGLTVPMPRAKRALIHPDPAPLAAEPDQRCRRSAPALRPHSAPMESTV